MYFLKMYQARSYVLALKNAGEVNGMYIDENESCSHLGCKLNYNKQEKTWDCPCHGSRFDESGKLLENPAEKGVKCIENKKN